MYNLATIENGLSVQRKVQPDDVTLCVTFREFVVNVQKNLVYLPVLGGQPHMTMIHSPGIYYSIMSSMSAYRENVLRFIGDHQATKEPTSVDPMFDLPKFICSTNRVE